MYIYTRILISFFGVRVRRYHSLIKTLARALARSLARSLSLSLSLTHTHLVRVDHEQISRNTDLMITALVALREPPTLSHLPQHRRHGRVVKKVGEAGVRGPGRALDVVIKTRCDT